MLVLIVVGKMVWLHDIILSWVLEALDPCAELSSSLCMPLPRLDAHLAAVLIDP